MEGLNKQDAVWLNVIEYFAHSEADVFLARHVLSLGCSSHTTTRIFSEHHLISTTGWTEYVIRRILGHWKNMGMAKSKPPPTTPVVVSQIRFGSGYLSGYRLLVSQRKHTGLRLELSIECIPLDKNRIERCEQQWEIDTDIFYDSLHQRICWLRRACHNTYHKLRCGCGVIDPSQHIPNETCTALICQACGEEVTEEELITKFNLANTPLYDAYTITIGGKFTPWVRPVMPESLRLRLTPDVSVSAEESEEWENSRDDEADVGEEVDSEEEIPVRGVLKRLSHLTEEDLELMTNEEYENYFKLCKDEDEWE